MKTFLCILLLWIAVAILLWCAGCAYNPPRNVTWQSPFRPPLVIENAASNPTQ